MTNQLQLAINPSAAKAFYDGLSPYPYVSGDVRTQGLWRTAKEKSVSFPTIQHNKEYSVRMLAFDVDMPRLPEGSDAFTWWQDCDAPPPNWILINPNNGNAHYFYELAVPVLLGGNSRAAPRNMMLKVERGLTKLLQADPDYVGLVAKNPLSGHWQTYTPIHESYTLADLAQYVDMTLPVPRKRESSGLMRHCSLFDELRYWCYSRVNQAKENGSYEQWFKTCLARCETLNTFDKPLPYASLKSTAKSVSKWTWSKYTGKGGKCRGRDQKAIEQWQGELNLRDKQQLSAQITNDQRKKATEIKICDAIRQLQSQNKRVTQAAVSRLSGINKVTISRYYKYLFC